MKNVLFFLFLFSFTVFSIGQKDSIPASESDSLLDIANSKTEKLLKYSDSIRLADSLELLNLEKQLSELSEQDEQKKQLLQQRLDSIQQRKKRDQEKLKKEIDSLRAGAQGVWVKFHDQKLFKLYAKIGPFSPSDRAKNLVTKLDAIYESADYNPKEFKCVLDNDALDIMYRDQILMVVTERDAFWANTSIEELGNAHVKDIVKGIEQHEAATSAWQKTKRILLLILVVLLLVVLIKLMNRLFTYLNKKLIRKSKHLFKGVKFKDYEFLSPEQQLNTIRYILRILKWGIIILIVYLTLPIILGLFPATKSVANTLLSYITSPIHRFWTNFVNYIPELITITVIIIIARYVNRFIRFLSQEVSDGKLKINGFYPEWAATVSRLMRIVVWVLTFIFIFPYLPGSDSPAFQGVSVFLGILISLGSSSAISNMIAGLVITFMRPFKIGDRVKIGDVSGDVLEKNMLITRIRTIKNEEVTIPNATILAGNTINYSTTKEEGVILYTTITIGYDVPWPKVHELLIAAALKCDKIQSEPHPFVLQTSLDDFYVSYQLNAYTCVPEKAAVIYSEIHQNIQDEFNAANIEIMSPHYRAQRDGNMVTIPVNYLPKDYKVPHFNVNVNPKNDKE